MLAVQRDTGASFLVGHSYGGLVALEVARGSDAFTKVAVYEPGVSIGGSMPVDWTPGYEENLAQNRRLDALIDYTRAVAPTRLRRIPYWLMKLTLRLVFLRFPGSRQMLNLLDQNLREWREIARLDGSYRSYREIAASVLLILVLDRDGRARSCGSLSRLALVHQRFRHWRRRHLRSGWHLGGYRRSDHPSRPIHHHRASGSQEARRLSLAWPPPSPGPRAS